jgi:hypothetical protein
VEVGGGVSQGNVAKEGPEYFPERNGTDRFRGLFHGRRNILVKHGDPMESLILIREKRERVE